MIPEKSLKIFHKILNFIILGLAIIVFILMIRLIKTDYFTNQNKVKEDTSNVENSNLENNSNIDSLENVGKKMMNLILPDNLNITVSDINKMETTPATIENGNIVVQNTTQSSNKNVNINQTTSASASANNVNNTIFTTQTKVNNENTPDLTTMASMNEVDYAYESMFRKVRNFLKFPNKQKFCPNIDDSESSFWVQLPEDYAGDHHAKFCCTSCYSLISKEIYCGQNQHGLYILDNFSVNDMAKLRELYDSTPELAEEFQFPEVILNSLLGKPVLKIRYDEDYHTIQVIKSLSELMEHEFNPAISTELYVRSYKCPAVVTKPVLQIVDV
jgi:hypothetical protein